MISEVVNILIVLINFRFIILYISILWFLVVILMLNKDDLFFFILVFEILLFLLLEFERGWYLWILKENVYLCLF